MAKILFYTAVWTLITLVFILALPDILPSKKPPTYSDDELRKSALSKGMLPVPKDYDALLKIKDNSAQLLTIEKIALGKELYFDAALSKNKSISCATCHMISKNPNERVILNELSHDSSQMTNCAVCHIRDESGTDRLSNSIGENGVQNPLRLNTLSILNSSLAKYLTWSAETRSVEEEAGVSMLSPFKMDMTPEALEQRLKNNPEYVAKFNEAFKDESGVAKNLVSFQNAKKALGAYVRTLLTRGAYDRFLDGENDAMSVEAKKGLANFINFGCKGCHTGMSVGGQVAQRFPLKDFFIVEELGFRTPFISSVNIYPFENVGGFLGKDDIHLFRVPILRNVTKTSPYFHNGSVPKIREAVAIMGKHQLGLYLSETQIDEIVAFLKTLEGDIVDYVPNK